MRYAAVVQQGMILSQVTVGTGINQQALLNKATAEATRRNSQETGEAEGWSAAVVPIMGQRAVCGASVNVEAGLYAGCPGGVLDLCSAAAFNAATNTDTATTMQKFYMSAGKLVAPTLNALTFAANGGRLAVSFKPAPDGSQIAEFTKCVAAWYAALGTSWYAILWQEPNTGKSADAGMVTADQYKAYCATYTPALRQFAPGVPIIYDPALCAPTDRCNAQSCHDYQPDSSLYDIAGFDFYGTADKSGARLEDVTDIADAYGKPLAVCEWGLAASSRSMTESDYAAYVGRMIETFSGRTDAGLDNGPIIQWASDDGGRLAGVDTIKAGDWKAKYTTELVTALAA